MKTPPGGRQTLSPAICDSSKFLIKIRFRPGEFDPLYFVSLGIVIGGLARGDFASASHTSTIKTIRSRTDPRESECVIILTVDR